MCFFERILIYLAVSLQTSDSVHGLVLSPVESVFVYTPYHNVKSVWNLDMHGRCTFRIAYPWPCAWTWVIHISQRRQRKKDWAMVVDNIQIKLGEVWTCGSWDKRAIRQTHVMCIQTWLTGTPHLSQYSASILEQTNNHSNILRTARLQQ